MVKKRITAKVAAVLVGLMIVSCVQPVAASEWTDETGEVMEMEEPAAETPETEMQQVAMPETIMPEIESELMEEDLLPAGDEDVSQKYTVTLRKPEGGQLVFSESMILPEQEILDEQTADCRAFAKDEVILISAVPEEGYILAEVKAESLTVEGVTYPLEEAAEIAANAIEDFILGEEFVKIASKYSQK